jgi:hypothetical protein
MEFKLNIYDGDEVVKTYLADDYKLKVGTAEDILSLVDVDKLSFDVENEAALLEIFKVVAKAFDSFRPMMKDVFRGLTDEEYSQASIVEVGVVVLNIIKYTFVQLTNAASGKN